MSFKLIKEMMGGEITFDTSMMRPEEDPNPAAGIFSKETEDRPDIISMDVPTLIRVMEWSHEDAKDDVQIHQLVNALIELSFTHEEPLSMQDYLEACQSVGVDMEKIKNYAEEPKDDEEYEVMFNN